MRVWLMLFGCCVACAGRELGGGADLPAVVRQVDGAVVAELRRAWIVAHAGAAPTEEVVILTPAPGGGFEAKLQPHSNLHGSSRFLLPPDAAAIFHTHPDSVLPQPSRDDRRLADRTGIPVFTLSSRGLFVYDPATGRISKLEGRLDWLEERPCWGLDCPTRLQSR
jgi:hypothetical protein